MDDNVLNNGEPIEMKSVTKKKATRKKVPIALQTIPMPEIGCYPVGDTTVLQLPVYSTDNAACFDVFAYLEITQDVVLYNEKNYKKSKKPLMLRGEDGKMVLSFVVNPGDRALIPTGYIFAIPEGYSIRFHPRSGLALKHFIGLANSEGVIDDDYIHQSYAMICNESEKQFVVELGSRICQGELVKNRRVKFKEILTKPVSNSNRTGGFGSTGK